ncbi:galactokinase [Pseudoalteromonas phenolica]|uniref:galactokinase n=1 Tax=Pseudoalteromonas phenolica TaxID=161398 RepID=UPI00207BABA4|nr:galactokinase [Pseudoalteromonas phenolica]
MIKQVFAKQFGYQAEQVIHAPGRVNLIGDHTDYNLGFVLPAAINFGTDVAIAKRDDSTMQVLAHDLDNQICEFELTELLFNPDLMWVNYVTGVVYVLQKAGFVLQGTDIVISGNVPQGAGLSSSASLQVALIKAFSDLFKLQIDGFTAAKLAQQAENEFVGCNCGVMDQSISAMGASNHAMLLDCQDLTFQDAPIPENLAIVIVNSNVKRGLVESEYNQRREQCEQVAKHFNVLVLRAVTLAELESEQANLSELDYKRARHVITENQRTLDAFAALKENNVSQLGRLMNASHDSLKDDFSTSTAEMDCLVSLIQSQIAEQGGARMTGGGFGGCVVAVMPKALVEAVTQNVKAEYQKQTGLRADVYVCEAVQGAFRA